MSRPIVLTVTEVALVHPDGPVRVSLSCPPSEAEDPNDRRAAGLTVIVPIQEAQTFYVIGAELELSLSPAAREPEREGAA